MLEEKEEFVTSISNSYGMSGISNQYLVPSQLLLPPAWPVPINREKLPAVTK